MKSFTFIHRWQCLPATQRSSRVTAFDVCVSFTGKSIFLENLKCSPLVIRWGGLCSKNLTASFHQQLIGSGNMKESKDMVEICIN